MNFDKTDKQLINYLSGDGRLSNNEIARKLSVSEGTVRKRMKKLTEAGALKISGGINPDAVSARQLVFIGIKVAVSKDLNSAAGRISELDNVQSVYITTGRYDIVAEAWLEVKSGIIDFLSGPLASINGIVSTETFIIIKSFGKWVRTNHISP
jgi:Lrp/AsnC family transcriptional regulator for asnA, asnC and gidA